jgi:raffinose/stachyose/melibiose transport system permease protein
MPRRGPVLASRRPRLVTEISPASSRAGSRRALRASFRRRGPRGIPLVWALPGLLLALLIHYVAVAAGGWYAFTDWNGIDRSPRWIGLGNFHELANDPVARDALFQTIKIAVVYVVLSQVIGLALALALNRTIKSRNLLRAIFFAPFVLSPLATAYIWRYIFDYAGPFNGLLAALHLEGWQRTWLGDPTWALWSVVIVMIWQGAGISMSFYLAGLQNVPEELDEAAAVDGASLWLRFRAVTLPMLAPAMTVSIALATINAMRVFDVVMALTNGGPGSATETLTTQIFKQGFANNRYGYGAAFALVLTIFIASVALTQILVLRRREQRL